MIPEAQARAIAEKLCERWFDTGARASWCPKMVDEFAAAIADTKASGPTWTTDKPTVPGWYWWRERPDHEPRILEVYHSTSSDEEANDLVTNIWTTCKYISYIGGEWSSTAIDPPEEIGGE